MYGRIGKFFFHLFHQRTDRRICQLSGCKRQFPDFVISLFRRQRLRKFIVQKTQHTDAVFQLQISVIPLFFRQFPSCQQIPLVAGMYDMLSILLIKSLLPPLDRVDHCFGIFFAKRLQRFQTVSVFAKSNRND